MTRAGRSSLALVLLGCAALAAPAADWAFDPVLTLQARHTDNPQQVEADTTEGDDLVSADLSLVLAATTPRSSSTFTYQPSYDWYQDNDALNAYAHFFGIAWYFTPTTRTRWDLTAGWTLTERPRVYSGTIDRPELFLPDQQRDTLFARAAVAVALSPRTSLNLALGAQRSDLDSVLLPVVEEDADGDGTPDGVTQADAGPNQSKQVDLSAGLSRTLSPLSSAGLELRASRIDEGFYGVRDVMRALLSYGRGTAERFRVTLTGGAAKTTIQDEPVVPAGLPEDAIVDTNQEPTTFVGSVVATGRVGLRGTVSAGLVRDVSSSSGLTGASIADAVFADYSHTVGRFSTFALRGRYSRFEPLRLEGTTTSQTKSHGATAEYGWAMSPRWFLVLAAEWIGQSGGDELGAPALDYGILSAGLRWAPTARPRPRVPVGDTQEGSRP
jgi:hypothetical protein